MCYGYVGFAWEVYVILGPSVIEKLTFLKGVKYTCQLFFSKMREIFHLHRIWISQDLATSSEDPRRFSTTSKHFPMTSDDNQRSRKIFNDFKTGRATISKGLPSNLEHYYRVPKMFWRFLERQKTIEFLFDRFSSVLNYTCYCQLGVRN